MPKWVDDCVKEYIKKGYSEADAWKFCQGAKAAQDRKEKKKKKK